MLSAYQIEKSLEAKKRCRHEKTYFDIEKIVNNLGVLRVEFTVPLNLF